MIKALLIDDDQQLGGPMAAYFARFDIALSHCLTPSSGLSMLERQSFEVLILDVMLPEMDGFALCKAIRSKWHTPIIMLTARGEVTDRVVGLELGADDYLAKPFEPRELVARVQTIVRRFQAANAHATSDALHTQTSHELQFEGLRISHVQRRAWVANSEVVFTSSEFDALWLLANGRGQVLSRDDIINTLRGHDAELATRAVDILVSRIRKKLEGVAHQNPIETVRNAGYRFQMLPIPNHSKAST